MADRFMANSQGAGRWLTFAMLLTALAGCNKRISSVQSSQQARESRPAPLVVIYRNDFNAVIGSTFPEWTSPSVRFHKTVTGQQGTLAASVPAIVESPNHRQ